MEQERKMKTGIECINAGKVFITPEGEHEVVRDLSFATKENEFLVLFGPGQCGKTTIINMIAGFEDVTSGQVLADGKRWKCRSLPAAWYSRILPCFPG